jgi:hypothetical protein
MGCFYLENKTEDPSQKAVRTFFTKKSRAFGYFPPTFAVLEIKHKALYNLYKCFFIIKISPQPNSLLSLIFQSHQASYKFHPILLGMLWLLKAAYFLHYMVMKERMCMIYIPFSNWVTLSRINKTGFLPSHWWKIVITVFA